MKYLIIILLIFVSCSSEDFFKGKKFKYKVITKHSNHIDTLTISTGSKLFFTKLETKLNYFSENMTINFSREGHYTANDKKVKIMPPIGGYLDFTEQLPHPEINLPPKLNDTIYSEHNISSTLPNAGKLIMGYQTVTDYKYYSEDAFKDSVWVVELYNKKDVKFKGKYYFSKKYGFIYFYYDLDGMEVEIKLIDLLIYDSE